MTKKEENEKKIADMRTEINEYISELKESDSPYFSKFDIFKFETGTMKKKEEDVSLEIIEKTLSEMAKDEEIMKFETVPFYTTDNFMDKLISANKVKTTTRTVYKIEKSIRRDVSLGRQLKLDIEVES